MLPSERYNPNTLRVTAREKLGAGWWNQDHRRIALALQISPSLASKLVEREKLYQAEPEPAGFEDPKLDEIRDLRYLLLGMARIVLSQTTAEWRLTNEQSLALRENVSKVFKRVEEVAKRDGGVHFVCSDKRGLSKPEYPILPIIMRD